MPRSLTMRRFRLEPLSERHNEPDHAAWTSSIGHIHRTPGFSAGGRPTLMTLAENRQDLARHHRDFEARIGFTCAVFDVHTGAYVGCVYLYPLRDDTHDVDVRSWVRAERAELDRPLAENITSWIAADWPWERLATPCGDRCSYSESEIYGMMGLSFESIELESSLRIRGLSTGQRYCFEMDYMSWDDLLSCSSSDVTQSGNDLRTWPVKFGGKELAVDLSGARAGHRLVLELTANRPCVTLVNADREFAVTIQNVVDWTTINLINNQCDIEISGGADMCEKISVLQESSLEIGPPEVQVNVMDTQERVENPSVRGSVALTNLHATYSLPASVSDVLIATDSILRFKRACVVHFSGVIMMDEPGYVDCLHLSDSARMNVNGLVVTEIKHDEKGENRVNLYSSGFRRCHLKVVHAEALHVFLQTSGSIVELTKVAFGISVSGPGVVRVSESSRVLGLRQVPIATVVEENLLIVLTQEWGIPVIEACPRSITIGLQGDFYIGTAAFANLLGDVRTGFCLIDIPRAAVDQPGQVFQDGVIENVKINDSESARHMWRGLLKAHRVIPLTAGTAVEEYFIWNQLGNCITLFKGFTHYRAHARAVDGWAASWLRKDVKREQKFLADSLYITFLADLARVKGAPGSVASKINWAEYRIRQTAAPRYERLVLAAYRIIGYGERPSPAFAVWITSAAMLTAINLQGKGVDFSIGGIKVFWESFSFWLVPSFGLLNMPEMPKDVNRDVNTFLLHGLLAIPFLTGVIALRRLVKRR